MTKWYLFIFTLFCILVLNTKCSFCQTVIVTDDAGYTSGNASAVLDVKSTTKGLLIPRMTTAQRNSISTPATGLMIYQIDGTIGYYYYNGTNWSALLSEQGGTTINTLGTITTGTWNANTISVAKGGTGLTSAVPFSLITGGVTATSTFQSVSTGSTGQVLQSNGTSALPSFSNAAFPSNAGTTGNVIQSNGTNFVSVENTGGWDMYRVSGTNVTTTSTTLVDITGLVTTTLSLNSNYEFEAIVAGATSASNTGIRYGVNVSGSPIRVLACYTGSTTSSAAADGFTNSNNVECTRTFYTMPNMNGLVYIKGMFTTGSTGAPVFSIKHLKITSGTSTVYVGSVLKIRKIN